MACALGDDVVEKLSVIHPNVHLGSHVLGFFVVLGEPPKGFTSGQLELKIGDDAIIRSHSVIYAGSMIGDRFQCGHGAIIREFTSIGSDCSIGTGSVVEFKVQMGNSVRLHSKVFVPEFSVLEDGCWLGPNVVITNAKFPLSKRAKETLRGVRICRGAKIGANSTLLPGITIGANALVGAGSVVTKDVAAGQVVVGSPARGLGNVFELKYDDTGLPAYEKT